MKRKSTLVLISFVFFTLFVLIFLLSTRRNEKYVNDLFKEYPLIDLSTGIDGIITNIYTIDATLSRNDPFKSEVIINDSIKKTISVGFELKSKIILENIICVGMRLKKHEGSKYLYLIKSLNGDTVKYEFTICDSRGFDIKSDN